MFVFLFRNPELWFRKNYFYYVEASRKAIATVINSDPNEVVLVENVSYAVNSVLRSANLQVLQSANTFSLLFLFAALLIVLVLVARRCCVVL